jgi:hypothetical protein
MDDSYNVFNFRTAQIDSVSPVAFNQLGKRRNMAETAKVKVKRTEIIEGRNIKSLKKCFLLFQILIAKFSKSSSSFSHQ